MIENGEDYGLGFPNSPKTPNTVSKILKRKKKAKENSFSSEYLLPNIKP